MSSQRVGVTPRRVPARARRHALPAVAFGAALGLANELAVPASGGGFMVGGADHLVLAPQGINWADASAFAGDWFMTAAPQPHWFFDLVVAAGRAAGHLAGALTLYYLCSLLVFGLATSVVARAWAPRVFWPAGLAYTVLVSVVGVALAGSNTFNAPVAQPNILGGQLTYLYLAALLTRRPWAPVVLPLVAVAHVQMGVLCLVVALLAGAAHLVERRLVERRLHEPGQVEGGTEAAPPPAGEDREAPRGAVRRSPLVWWLIGASAAGFGLALRPVASDLSSFAEICRAYIPFHCAAPLWPPTQVLSSLGGCALALLGGAFVREKERVRYLATVGLASVGLAAAIVADRANVPGLATVIEGLNLYRAAVLIFPLACWAVLLPLTRPRRDPLGLLATAAVVPAAVAFAAGTASKLPVVAAGHLARGWALAVAVSLLVAAGAAVFSATLPRGHLLRAGLLAVLAVCAFTSARVAGGQSGTGFHAPTWNPDSDLRAWGADVRSLVRPGDQVMIPPTIPGYRLTMERGVVVDCKTLPYGGPAYRQWIERMDALGGVRQCVTGSGGYGTRTGAQLDEAARRYGATAIVFPAAGYEDRIRALTDLGYREVRLTRGGYDTTVLVRG